jgi:hypothetical protein
MRTATRRCVLSACTLLILLGFLLPASAAPLPVSATPVPPPGVMPVVVLQGSPYEMGYQYGLQAPEYIAIVRDAAWATALSKSSSDEVTAACAVYREYITNNLTAFRFTDFFAGMSDAMNDQGYAFTPDDPVVMLYYGGRSGPVPDEHCTAFVALGNATGGGIIAGDNFDFYPVPANSYAVLLALYPDDGYSCIIPSGAGRTGSNAVVNEAGLVYILTSAPSGGAGDTGPGITGYLELPYVGMTAGSVAEAEQTLLAMTRGFALNRLLADTTGAAEVLEATRARYAVRYPDGGDDYIIATNHYLDPAMQPSQDPWDPLRYYPSSYYRFITAEKMIRESHGTVSHTTAREILSSCDWWDGRERHADDPWSANTINRFRPDVATLYSFIAVPDERVVSICLGNPGMPFWGTRAAGQTGTFVNVTVGGAPDVMVYDLRCEAEAEMWRAVQAMNVSSDRDTTAAWNALEDRYWEGVWWHNRGVLENTATARAVAFGRAATAFADVAAHAAQVRESDPA